MSFVGRIFKFDDFGKIARIFRAQRLKYDPHIEFNSIPQCMQLLPYYEFKYEKERFIENKWKCYQKLEITFYAGSFESKWSEERVKIKAPSRSFQITCSSICVEILN